MANAKPKPSGQKIYNSDRPNRKAWKKRHCGMRHGPTPCRQCKVSHPVG